MKVKETPARPNALIEFVPPRWEYLASVGTETTMDFGKLGVEGWELVAVVPKPADPGLLVAFFKRKVI